MSVDHDISSVFATPKLPFKKSDYLNIYEPAEDSFLLLDALQSDILLLQKLNPTIVLEIGSGSGIITAFVNQIIGHRIYLTSDINSHACQATQNTAQFTKFHIDVLEMSLGHGLINGKIDLLIFNPPYVVTTDEEIDQGIGLSKATNLYKSWAGGIDGRCVIDEFLAKMDSILSPNGFVYLVLINENKPAEICIDMEKLGFVARLVIYRAVGWEGLSVYQFHRSPNFYI